MLVILEESKLLVQLRLAWYNEASAFKLVIKWVKTRVDQLHPIIG
jgi:hypothetical protein